MPKYKFRLETLLKMRAALRDQRRGELAEAYRAEQLLKQKTDEVRLQWRRVKDECRKGSQPGDVSVDRLLNTHRYQMVLQAQTGMLRQQGEKVEAEIQRRRDALARADQQVRILEKLREKQYGQHLQQEARLEMKQIDEVAQRRRAASGDAPS